MAVLSVALGSDIVVQAKGMCVMAERGSESDVRNRGLSMARGDVERYVRDRRARARESLIVRSRYYLTARGKVMRCNSDGGCRISWTTNSEVVDCMETRL
jgi:hypothetical protein